MGAVSALSRTTIQPMPDQQVNYNEMLDRYRNGETAAREQLFSVLQVRLSAILKYRLRGWPADDLDDILQDTLAVVIERLDRIESNPDLFALEVLRRKIGNSLARHGRRIGVSVEVDPPDETGRPAVSNPADRAALSVQEDITDRLESDEMAEAIYRAIRRLSPLCRTLFAALLEYRSVSETWKLVQTADHGLKRSAFDKRLFDCRRKLRRLMAPTLGL